MGRFYFRMESILNVREKIEEQKKQEYSNALNELHREISIKEKLTEESNELIHLLRSKIHDSIALNEIIFYNNYGNFLKRKIIKQEENVKLAYEKAEKKRQELIEASRQKKMLEKLKEKHWFNFLDDENKKEQRSIDEVVSFQSQNRLIDRSETNS